eukprot:SAG11_NODE_8617_length_995_cov_1.210938_2_plen_212_part_01
MGLLDTGANVVTVRLWGKRAEPFVQSLHASFAVGALVAPLLAEQFISHGGHAAAVAAACASGGGGGNSSLPSREVEAEAAVGGGVETAGQKASLAWAFWVSALLMVPSALGLTWLTPQFPQLADSNLLHQRVGGAAGEEDGGEEEGEASKQALAHPRLLLGLGLLLFGLFVGAEIGFGGYIFAYAVASCDLKFDESAAAYLTAIYWGAFTTG